MLRVHNRRKANDANTPCDILKTERRKRTVFPPRLASLACRREHATVVFDTFNPCQVVFRWGVAVPTVFACRRMAAESAPPSLRGRARRSVFCTRLAAEEVVFSTSFIVLTAWFRSFDAHCLASASLQSALEASAGHLAAKREPGWRGCRAPAKRHRYACYV